jgi:protein O-mannosyl-transferase
MRRTATKSKPGPTRASTSVMARSHFPAWLMAILLLLAAILAYQPVWQAGFIWDDDVYVTANPLLTAPDGLWRIWFSFDSPSQYFPLTYTAFRMEYQLWGLNPAGYHWVNLLLHITNAFLLWRLLVRMRAPGAWLAATIFALHPVQVESVAWVTELKNVLMLFFFLLSLRAWVEFLDEKTNACGHFMRWH